MPYLSASPAAKSKEVFEALEAMESATHLNEFEVKKLEREAERLVKADAESGYTVLGVIAAMRGDADGAHAYHKMVLKLTGESANTLYNYATSLAKLGEHAKALEFSRRAYARNPADPTMLHRAIAASIFTGNFREASDLGREWNESDPKYRHAPDPVVDAICSATEREIFTEERLQEVLGIAHEVLRSSKMRALGVEIQDDEHEPDSFLYEFFVFASPDEAEVLNAKLDARILDCPHLMDDPGLKFVPVLIGASVDGGYTERSS